MQVSLRVVLILLVCLHCLSSIVVNQDKKKQLARFLAGGIAGSISSTLTLPLEVVKTQLQSSAGSGRGLIATTKGLLNKGGVKIFFRGLAPLLVGIVPTRALYFWAYSTTKEKLGATSLQNGPVNHLLSAFSAGILSNTVRSYLVACLWNC
jgi:hypothetical protein